MSWLPVHIQVLIGAGIAIGYIGYTLYQSMRHPPQVHGHERSGPSRRGGYGGASNDVPNYTSKPGDKCVICLYTMYSDDMRYMPCYHALHTSCYEESKRRINKCPLCQVSL